MCSKKKKLNTFQIVNLFLKHIVFYEKYLNTNEIF